MVCIRKFDIKSVFNHSKNLHLNYLCGMKTVHLKITGKVQGVFFRAKAKEIAEFYHISGWIRNMFDDNVEALISGEDEEVEKFILWCKHGPERAKVKDVEITYKEVKLFERFEVIR